MSRLVHNLSRSYLLVAILAMIFGLVAPKLANIFSNYTTFFLALIFFLTALKLDFKEVIAYLRDWRMVAEINLLMLLVIPILIYYLMQWLDSALALPFVILSAMPTAMAAPLVVDFMGGRQGLALVITATTSLFAPLTIPLVIGFVADTQIQISFLNMFWSLAKVIFIPFLLAEIIKYFWSDIDNNNNIIKFSTPISVTLLGLIIASVASRQTETIINSIAGGQTLKLIGWLILLFLLLHILGYLAIFWRSPRDRFTISVCLTYMNFLLAIYLVDNFFPVTEVEVPVILSVVPWTLLLPVSGWAAKKLLIY